MRSLEEIYFTRQKFSISDFLGLLLIIISSILLGIWAVKGTIALRNILLGIGTPLSLFYCYQYFKFNQQKIPLKNFIPIILIGLIFCWVIFHYFFLSRFPEIQLHELKSTWLRALLATIVGFGTGLAILKRPNAVNFLWLGILISFAYLFYQYIPLVISTGNLKSHSYDQFIYSGKINGVLAGTILIAGLLGTLLDRYPSFNIKIKIIMFLFWLIGSCAVLYAYVYIFDARNGIGIGALLFSFASMMLIFKTNWQNPHILGCPQSLLSKTVAGNVYEQLSWATARINVFTPQNLLGVGIFSEHFTVLLSAKYSNSDSYKSFCA